MSGPAIVDPLLDTARAAAHVAVQKSLLDTLGLWMLTGEQRYIAAFTSGLLAASNVLETKHEVAEVNKLLDGAFIAGVCDCIADLMTIENDFRKIAMTI